MLNKFAPVMALCCELFLVATSPVLAEPSISLSATPGANWDSSLPPDPASLLPRDWLTDANPLLIWPNHSEALTVKISPTVVPLTPNYSGTLNLTTACCGILGWPGEINPGVNAVVGAGIPIFLHPHDVQVTGSPVERKITLSTRSVSLPGDWVLRVRAQDPSQNIDKATDVLFTVLPARPDDGIPPKCTPNLEIVTMSQFKVYDLKVADPSTTVWPFAITSKVGSRGLQVTFHKPSTPLPPNTALVTFKHNIGWRTGIRNDNSNNCAASGTTKVVEAGQSVSFMISTADTTTLVLSRPVCREMFFWICLKVGLNDTIEFSEGPFWTLFGGHQVDIETVGDWGADQGSRGVGAIIPPH
jgi:hypothetical protein